MFSPKILKLSSAQSWKKLVVPVNQLSTSLRNSTSTQLDEQYIQRSITPTMHFQKSLPLLALPNLEDTTRKYLEAQKPLLDSDQFTKTKQITENFLGYEGRALHAELVEKRKQMKNTSYISEPWFDMYVKYRDSIVLNHNPYILATDDPNTTDQLTRATKAIHAAMRFKRSLDESLLEPDVYHLNPKKSDNQMFRRLTKLTPSSLSWYTAYLFKAFPLDMSQYGRLFNSTRLPCPNKDQLFTNRDSRKILVIRNGNIFLFDVLDDQGNIISRDAIHANLKSIMDSSNNLEKHPLAVLTAEKRETWAQLRERLVSNGDNGHLLHELDSALFGVFLDDKHCTDEKDASDIFLHGEGHSRWFDKSFHIAFSGNGKMAINFEHAWGDGVAVVRFLNEITKASQEDSFTPEENSSIGMASVQKLDFQLDETLKESIKKAQQTFDERISTLKVSAQRFEEMGKNFIKTKKLSPDAVMQLAFQIAHYRQNGHHTATYESCSTAAFKHGRTETIRPCTTATVACAEAFEANHPASVEEMTRLLKETSDIHGALTKDAAMGAGFDRHLFALRHLAEGSGRTGVEFFEDVAYKNINHVILSTSTVGSPYIQLGGFAPVVHDGLGVGYMIQDDWLGCNVSSYPDSPNGGEFVELVMQSLTDIHTVLKGHNFKK